VRGLKGQSNLRKRVNLKEEEFAWGNMTSAIGFKVMVKVMVFWYRINVSQ